MNNTSYIVRLALNHSIQSSTKNRALSCNEDKDESLLLISFIEPSIKPRNNVGDRLQPCTTT